MKSHITQLEQDLDKFRASFQQNSTNAAVWKQQLADYQQANEQMTQKMAEFELMYEKFGDILSKKQ